jgi:hypothetical protein
MLPLELPVKQKLKSAPLQTQTAIVVVVKIILIALETL